MLSQKKLIIWCKYNAKKITFSQSKLSIMFANTKIQNNVAEYNFLSYIVTLNDDTNLYYMF